MYLFSCVNVGFLAGALAQDRLVHYENKRLMTLMLFARVDNEGATHPLASFYVCYRLASNNLLHQQCHRKKEKILCRTAYVPMFCVRRTPFVFISPLCAPLTPRSLKTYTLSLSLYFKNVMFLCVSFFFSFHPLSHFILFLYFYATKCVVYYQQLTVR